jgi:hypothetical protein
MVFQLPANRYVPSTKRYNLIFADQLFGLPQNKIQFVAQNYVATQKIFSYQADDYRAINSNFLVVSYHLANGLNPQHHDDCPDPKNNTGSGFIGVVAPNGFVSEWNDYFLPWLSTHSIAVGSNQYEAMFQHYDTIDSTHRVWHIDPFWNMNLENPDWRTYFGDILINWLNGNENEGAFIDVSVETMVSPLYHPNQNDPTPYNFNWYISPHGPAGYTINTLNDFAAWMNNQYLNYYQYIYQRFHTGVVDYLVLPNTDQMVTGWYDPVWADGNGGGETIDGAMMENFGSYTGSDMYLTLERGMRHLTGRGKILIAQFSDTSQYERYRRVGMYMLIKNENSFLCIQPGHVNWFPEYEIDLGDQSTLPNNLDSLRISGSGSNALFKRDFADGMVLCNTSGTQMSYTPIGSNWNKVITSGGGDVDNLGMIASQSIQYVPVLGTVTINPSECVILKKLSGTSIAENRIENYTMKVYELNGQFNIEINSLENFHDEIFISDLTGRILKNIYSGNIHKGLNLFQISNQKLSAGLYFVGLKKTRTVSKVIVE